MTRISIHTLRVEGDISCGISSKSTPKFQSTPSVWRVTYLVNKFLAVYKISIHTLRVEGDVTAASGIAALQISIHTLRVEGDN